MRRKYSIFRDQYALSACAYFLYINGRQAPCTIRTTWHPSTPEIGQCCCHRDLISESLVHHRLCYHCSVASHVEFCKDKHLLPAGAAHSTDSSTLTFLSPVPMSISLCGPCAAALDGAHRVISTSASPWAHAVACLPAYVSKHAAHVACLPVDALVLYIQGKHKFSHNPGRCKALVRVCRLMSETGQK